MKKLFLMIATATALLSAQVVPSQSCPRYGTPQQGQGPRDGTGYGAKKAKGNGPQNGQGQQAGRMSRGGRR